MHRPIAVLLTILTLCTSLAHADDGPLRIVVPTPPGGTNDGVARALQDPLQRLLNRPVIVDYKPGAAGSVGSTFVARSKPDGGTLLLNNNAVIINPQLSKTTGYEMKDLTPVSVAAVSPLVLMVNAAVPAKDVKGFIAYARSQNQPLPFGSSGVGGVSHLAMESFAKAAGIKVLHVPYQGGAPAQVALSSGEVKVALTAMNPVLKGLVDAGRIRLLGIASAAPSPLVPGTPTIGEALPGFVLDVWFGLLAPAQTPRATIERFSEAVAAAMLLPEVRDKIKALGSEPVYMGNEAFAKMVSAESQRWREAMRDGQVGN